MGFAPNTDLDPSTCRRIIATLLAMAVLCEHAAARSLPVRLLVLWILHRAEAAALTLFAVPADALEVTAESKPNAYPTLAEALVAVTRDGRTIVVKKPLAEQVALGPGSAKNLTIVAGAPDGGQSWKPPQGADPTKPLLKITGCDGLTVAGFGFDGEEGCVLAQIGEELNISRERVRQIEAQALRKLRHEARKGRLRELIQA